MNLVYNIIFIITSICIIIYDFKYQKIPTIYIVLNFISICLLTNIYLLISLINIYIIKNLDKSIDSLYLMLLAYIMYTSHNIYSILSILILLVYILFSKSNKISLMVPIELALIYELCVLKFL